MDGIQLYFITMNERNLMLEGSLRFSFNIKVFGRFQNSDSRVLCLLFVVFQSCLILLVPGNSQIMSACFRYF